jgi:IclR family pca regulon transcriptional regulator
MDSNDKSSEFISALARGLEVIQAFTAERPEMTLSEVAAATGITPATARRCLLTLQAMGFVGCIGRRFVLRPKVLSLGSAFLMSMNLREVAQPWLQDLVEEFHDSASLAVLDSTDVLYVALASSKKRKGFRAAVGYRTPAYATSLGHVLLANLPEQKLRDYLALGPFPMYTSKTCGDPVALAAALEKVRELGYAQIQDQFEYGVLAVSVPVTDIEGRVVAAVNCSSEDTRIDMAELIETRVPRLREVARQISHALERSPSLIHSVLSEPGR